MLLELAKKRDEDENAFLGFEAQARDLPEPAKTSFKNADEPEAENGGPKVISACPDFA